MGCDSEGCGCNRSYEDLKIAPQVVEKNKHIIIKRPEIVEKGWGRELHIHNDDGYCGKVLQFNKDAKFSMHYHVNKKETWYVAKGKLMLKAIDPSNANISEIEISVGDVIDIDRGLAHQLIALEISEIFEVSQPDDPDDSYRVWKGDSQIM